MGGVQVQIRVTFLLFATLLMVGGASATTLYVNETGWYRSGDTFNATATPIQHAVDNATAGDTVYVWNGSYDESTVHITTSSITVEGESNSVVILNGSGYIGFDISNADYVTVKNFNCGVGDNSDMDLNTANHCIIKHLTNLDAVTAQTADNLTFSHNALTEHDSLIEDVTNSAFYYNIFGGLRFTNNADNVFTSNTFYLNTGGMFGYLAIYGNNVDNAFTDIDFVGNLIASNVPDISYSGGSNNIFTDITFEHSTAVVRISTGADVKFVQNNRKIFVPIGGYWEWHYGPPHWNDWVTQTVSGLNITIDGSQSVMHFTPTVSVSTGSTVDFNFPHFYYNPSSGSYNISDTVWNTTIHGRVYHATEDFYSNDSPTRGTKTFNVTATDPAATASIQCGDFGRGTYVQMLVNGIDNGTVLANSAGVVSFAYTDGFSGTMQFNITTYNKTGTSIFQDVFNTVYANGTIDYSDWVAGGDSINTTIIPETGSVEIRINESIINADYHNTNIYDLNITELDGTLLLKDAGVSTMMFSVKNNLFISLWDIRYWINATTNRKAAEMKTYSTNPALQLNFTFYDLYPSSNFDCHYDSASFTTNTSNSSGVLQFANPTWITSTSKLIELYMTTTPYRCGGVCAINEGDPMMLYLDLNDTTVTHVRIEITKPNGDKANHSMSDFLEDGETTWYISYADTGNAGTYTVNNFYSSKDGATWKQLDSFLTFESKSSSGGSSGGGDDGGDGGADGDDGGDAGGGGGAQPEPIIDDHGIKPDKSFTATLTNGQATFDGSIVTRVNTEQSGTVQIDEYKINPTATSLIGGTRYGYADITVEDRNIGGTVCFAAPTTAIASIYHLEDNEWVELNTRSEGDSVCADVGHFSYFALADEEMESVIESMTQLSLNPPKVSGILIWKWVRDDYTSRHTANRELVNVSASEGMVCEILSEGDYPNRILKCVYTPEEGDWSSLKYTGEVIAIDQDGYTARIPVSVQVHDMERLGFPLLAGLILLGGIILYRRYD